LPSESELQFHLVPCLEFAGQQYRPWQEAVERDVEVGTFRISDLIHMPIETRFDFPAQRAIEPLRNAQGPIAAVLFRQQQQLIGMIQISATRLADGLHRITVRTTNQTALDAAETKSRDDALMRSLISMHVILGAHDGELVSLTDPPGQWASFAQSCKNIGTWPVLVGTGSERDCILSSPIILYDYPQLAPESPGDLFDGTEIDEILTLRILTLTDEEKRSAAAVDDRTRQMLQRTESLARGQLASLHGTIRGMKPVDQPQADTIGSTP
jgi:hydrogenase maturation protease